MEEVDYKKYSIDQLNVWLNDLIENEKVSSSEIYYSMKTTILEAIEYHQKQVDKCQELLNLIEGRTKLSK